MTIPLQDGKFTWFRNLPCNVLYPKEYLAHNGCLNILEWLVEFDKFSLKKKNFVEKAERCSMLWDIMI